MSKEGSKATGGIWGKLIVYVIITVIVMGFSNGSSRRVLTH
ncbi:MAG: hypothetical protein OWQ48_00775 [Desulfurococcus sp.]|nr:hypothetical protein [Desulfurococcus sp.]